MTNRGRLAHRLVIVGWTLAASIGLATVFGAQSPVPSGPRIAPVSAAQMTPEQAASHRAAHARLGMPNFVAT